MNARETLLVIDIGGTHVKFAFSVNGGPHAYSRLFSSDALREGEPVSELARMIVTIGEESGLVPDCLIVAVPGFIGRDGDTVLFAGNLLRLNGRRLATELSGALSVPVFLERDSVLALMGEAVAGVCQGVPRVLGIYFGTGVGAAYLEEGRPFRGAGWALELGHIPFRSEGRVLEGLKTDCLETYVSGRALRLIADDHDTPIEEVFSAAAAAPDSPFGQAIEDFIRDMSIAVGIAATLFSADTIVLGGGVCELADFPRDRLAALVESKAPFEQTGQDMDLRWAQHGWRSALYGAPMAVAEHTRRMAA